MNVLKNRITAVGLFVILVVNVAIATPTFAIATDQSEPEGWCSLCNGQNPGDPKFPCCTMEECTGERTCCTSPDDCKAEEVE